MAKPFLIVVLGGPASGKTSLAAAIHEAFPGLCPVSGGDLARLATGKGATERSRVLHGIAKQFAEGRHPKQAAEHLNDIVLSAMAKGFYSNEDAHGLVADSLRVADLKHFEEKLAAKVTCVLQIICPRQVMISRQSNRGAREGDRRLGATEHTKRIDAYLSRVADEEVALRRYFQSCKGAVNRISGAIPREELAREAINKVWCSAKANGPSSLRVLKLAENARAAHIDWLTAVIGTDPDATAVDPSAASYPASATSHAVRLGSQSSARPAIDHAAPERSLDILPQRPWQPHSRDVQTQLGRCWTAELPSENGAMQEAHLHCPLRPAPQVVADSTLRGWAQPHGFSATWHPDSRSCGWRAVAPGAVSQPLFAGGPSSSYAYHQSQIPDVQDEWWQTTTWAAPGEQSFFFEAYSPDVQEGQWPSTGWPVPTGWH